MRLYQISNRAFYRFIVFRRSKTLSNRIDYWFSVTDNITTIKRLFNSDKKAIFEIDMYLRRICYYQVLIYD